MAGDDDKKRDEEEAEATEMSDLFVDPLTGEVQEPLADLSDLDANEDEDSDAPAADDLAAEGTSFGSLVAESEMEGTPSLATDPEDTDSPEAATNVGELEFTDFATASAADEQADVLPAADEEIDLPPDADTSPLREDSPSDQEIEADVAEMDAMIDDAMTSQELHAADAEASIAVESAGAQVDVGDRDARARYYRITIRGLQQPERRRRAVEIINRNPPAGIEEDFAEKMMSLGGYRLSHLSEFHAALLMQQLAKADLDCCLDLPKFSPLADEDDLVGKSLAVSAEGEDFESTGARAIPIPESSADILLTTLSDVPGYVLQQNQGIVSAHGSVARTFFRETEVQTRLKRKVEELRPSDTSAVTKVARGQRDFHLPKAEMDKVFQNLLKSLQFEALRRGANGVIGIQLTGFPETNAIDPESDQIRLIASGTAVLLEPESGSWTEERSTDQQSDQDSTENNHGAFHDPIDGD